MALFESYERRIDKINGVLAQYGIGSSTIFTAIALGMILSVSRQNDEQSHDMPKSESIYEK